MKAFFPVEVAAEEVDILHLFATGPFNMVQVDQFGDAGKIGVGAAGQNSAGVPPDRAQVDGGYFAFNQDRNQAQQLVVAEPFSQFLKSSQKAVVMKI